MAGLILNYEKELDEYASAWANVKKLKEKGRADKEDIEKAFGRPFSPASGASPQSLKKQMMSEGMMNYQDGLGLSPIGVSGFGDPL